MRFWIDFILVNIMFFGIPFFLNIKNQPNPFGFFMNKGFNLKTKLKFFYDKESSDPFKIFVEYSIVILIASLFDFDILISSIVASLVGLFGAVLILYAGVFMYIFRKPPMILSDWSFTKVGLKLLKNKKYGVVILLILILAGIFWALFHISNHLLSYQPMDLSIYIVLTYLFGLGYYNTFKYGYSMYYNRTLYSPFFHFVRNIKESNKFNYLLARDQEYFKKFNLYQDFNLESRPNIVIINVESYGSINFKDEFFKDEIRDKLKEKEAILKNAGFYSASAFSTPPIFAGGSWLCYSTVLFGTKIYDQNQYELLMKGNKGFDAYQSIPRYLETQGYKNLYLCPLGGGFFQNVDWDVVYSTIGAHQYITFDDIEYEGKTLNFMDLGSSAPDQYSINKAKDMIDKSGEEPYCMFYCTLNSHTPFNSPRKIVENWTEIPTLDYKTNGDLSTKKEKYKTAIHYQLDFLFNYIEKNKEDNTIYLFFGDHQPPFITKKEMGWDTNIHIISKNKKFVDVFEKYGFGSGLVIDDQLLTIRHEGIMSIFMKALFNVFGKSENNELPYLENGIQFDQTNL